MIAQSDTEKKKTLPFTKKKKEFDFFTSLPHGKAFSMHYVNHI